MIDAAKRSDAALAFESADGETGTIARRGVSSWQLKITGVQSHSSDIFTEEIGAGAVFEAARILNNILRADAFGTVFDVQSIGHPGWHGREV